MSATVKEAGPVRAAPLIYRGKSEVKATRVQQMAPKVCTIHLLGTAEPRDCKGWPLQTDFLTLHCLWKPKDTFLCAIILCEFVRLQRERGKEDPKGKDRYLEHGVVQMSG